MERDFHHRLRDGFLKIAADEPDRCAVIDASRDIDAVTSDIFSVVQSRLGVSVS